MSTRGRSPYQGNIPISQYRPIGKTPGEIYGEMFTGFADTFNKYLKDSEERKELDASLRQRISGLNPEDLQSFSEDLPHVQTALDKEGTLSRPIQRELLGYLQGNEEAKERNLRERIRVEQTRQLDADTAQLEAGKNRAAELLEEYNTFASESWLDASSTGNPILSETELDNNFVKTLLPTDKATWINRKRYSLGDKSVINEPTHETLQNYGRTKRWQAEDTAANLVALGKAQEWDSPKQYADFQKYVRNLGAALKAGELNTDNNKLFNESIERTKKLFDSGIKVIEDNQEKYITYTEYESKVFQGDKRYPATNKQYLTIKASLAKEHNLQQDILSKQNVTVETDYPSDTPTVTPIVTGTAEEVVKKTTENIKGLEEELVKVNQMLMEAAKNVLPTDELKEKRDALLREIEQNENTQRSKVPPNSPEAKLIDIDQKIARIKSGDFSYEGITTTPFQSIRQTFYRSPEDGERLLRALFKQKHDLLNEQLGLNEKYNPRPPEEAGGNWLDPDEQKKDKNGNPIGYYQIGDTGKLTKGENAGRAFTVTDITEGGYRIIKLDAKKEDKPDPADAPDVQELLKAPHAPLKKEETLRDIFESKPAPDEGPKGPNEPEPVEKGPKGAKGKQGPSGVKKPKSGDPYISKAGKKYPNLVYDEYNSDTDSWTVRPAEGYTFEVPLVEGKRRTNWNIIPIPKTSPTMKAVKDALKPMQTPLPDAPVIPENVRKAIAGDEGTMADLFESGRPAAQPAPPASAKGTLSDLFDFGKIADLKEMGSEDASALLHLYESIMETDSEEASAQLEQLFIRVAEDVIERGDANNMDEIIKALKLQHK